MVIHVSTFVNYCIVKKAMENLLTLAPLDCTGGGGDTVWGGRLGDVYGL